MKFSFNLNIDKKIYLLIGTLSVLIIGILMFAIYPFYTKIGELNTELYDQRAQLAIYQQQRFNLYETRIEYNNIKSDIDTITSVFVKRDDILTFIDSLDSISQNNSVKQNINLSNLDEKIESEKLIMDINLTGNWENLNNYLYTLESLDYYILIDNLKLINYPDSILMEFNLAVYLQ